MYVLQTAANRYCKVKGIGFFCTSGIATDANIKVEVMRASTNFASGGTTKAPVTNNVDLGASISVTGKVWAGGATEPTLGAVVRTYYFHPQSNFKEVFYPGDEIVVGGASADYLAIRFDTAQSYGSNEVTIELDLEE
jgi:hypothetical protein